MVDEEVEEVVERNGNIITASCDAAALVAVLEDETAVGDLGDAHTGGEEGVVSYSGLEG